MPFTPTTTSRLQSKKAFDAANLVLPGGVNSPVRAFKGVGGHPVFIKKAQGATLWDLDDNTYIDLIGSWGPMILGHAHQEVLEALHQVMQNGTSFGAPTEQETALAELVIAMVPSVEVVRFVNSGTEAAMSGVRLARAFTGKQKLIKFAGCYHGHVDALLVQAGSGATTLGLPDSPGVVGTGDTLTAQYNDLASVRACFEAFPRDVAAVLVEPVAGNMGCVAPEPNFLTGLRALCDEFNSLLVFDEVMTGFRLSSGGAQKLLDVIPDLTLMGKIIGGGLPVGAYGGRQDIMAMVAPAGPMYQAGTLSGNPLAMTAGLVTLQYLTKHPEVYEQLETLTTQLAEGLRGIMRSKAIPVTVNHVGSMLTLFFTQGPVSDFNSALCANRDQFSRFFWHMLDNGVYFPPSQFEACFLSIAHTETHIRHLLESAKQFEG